MRMSPRGRPDEEFFIWRGFRFTSESDAAGVGKRLLVDGWPEGFPRIVSALQRLEATVLGLISGHPVNLGCVYAINPLAVELVPRLLSAFLGTAACLLVGLTVRRLVAPGLRSHALALGTLALGVNYLAGRDAHFGVTDATLLFCVSLCLYSLLRALGDSPRWLLLAGAVAGAGFAIKFAAASLAIPCLIGGVGCLARWRGQRAQVSLFGIGALLLGVGAFGLLSPRALTSFPLMWRTLMGYQDRYGGGAGGYLLDPSAILVPGWRFHLMTTLPTAFGWFGFAAAVAGFGVAWRRDRWATAVLAGSALGAFALIARVSLLFVRYASPMLPSLAIALGLLLASAWPWAREHLGVRAGAAATVLLAGAALLPPALRLAAFDRLMARPDTRDLASDWVLAQNPQATLIGEGKYAQVHSVEAGVQAACRAAMPDWLFRQVATLPGEVQDWRGLVASGEPGWDRIADGSLNDCYCEHAPPLSSADFVAQGRAALPCGRPGKAEWLHQLDPACFKLVKTFEPGPLACDDYVDLFDSFYVPYDGFSATKNPGPTTAIYQNLCRR
jgi:hypothetical protein